LLDIRKKKRKENVAHVRRRGHLPPGLGSLCGDEGKNNEFLFFYQ
jgi:hypothetical protein